MMVYSPRRLAEAVEPKLINMFQDAEIVNYDNDYIEFNALIHGEWLEGLIEINYTSDLAVKIKYRGNGYYSYVGDIYWCDLEEVLGA